jgi:hypothetical protein
VSISRVSPRIKLEPGTGHITAASASTLIRQPASPCECGRDARTRFLLVSRRPRPLLPISRTETVGTYHIYQVYSVSRRDDNTKGFTVHDPQQVFGPNGHCRSHGPLRTPRTLRSSVLFWTQHVPPSNFVFFLHLVPLVVSRSYEESATKSFPLRYFYAFVWGLR